MASLPPSAVASDNTAAAPPVTAVWAMMTVALSPVFSTRVLVVGEKGQSCEKDPLRRRTLKRLPARSLRCSRWTGGLPRVSVPVPAYHTPGSAGCPRTSRTTAFRSSGQLAVGVVMLARPRGRSKGRVPGPPAAKQLRPGRRSPASSSRSRRGTSRGPSGPRRPAPGSLRSRPPGSGRRCRSLLRTRCRRAAGLLARGGLPAGACGPESLPSSNFQGGQKRSPAGG